MTNNNRNFVLHVKSSSKDACMITSHKLQHTEDNMTISKIFVLLFGVASSLEYQGSTDDIDNGTCWIQASCKSIERLHLANSILNRFPVTHSAVSLSLKDCSPWMFRNETSGACECSDIPYRAVLCDPTIPRTSVLDCFCMTFNSERNETELGRCLYGCGHTVDTVYHQLPQNKLSLNTYTCGGASRDSTLCGECKPGYSPLVYSYDMSCMNCTGMTYNWIKYIAVAYIPLTFFYFFVVIVRFSGTSPLMRGYISFCQGIMSPICIRAFLTVATKKASFYIYLKIVGTLYGVWNLDFFRLIIPPICLAITPLQALILDYAIAFYPLFLILLTYSLINLHSRGVRIVVWLWKPFHRVCQSVKQDWDFEGSVVKTFATFFLLSYLKILNVTTDLLVYTEKYILPLGEQRYRATPALYYDPSVEYFRGDHLYYGITAVVIGLFIVVLPLILLVVYPMRWFQKTLNFCGVQRQSLATFVDCYQGYYKDGTNGTRDYRCFSITYFLLEITVFISFTLTKSILCLTFSAFLAVLFMFTILSVQPYKEQFKAYSIIDASVLLILAGLLIMLSVGSEADVKDVRFSTPSYLLTAIIGLVPCFYLIGLMIWWIFVKKNLKRVLPCFQKYKSVQLEASLPDRLEYRMDRQISAEVTPLLTGSQEQGHNQRPQHGSAQASQNVLYCPTNPV